jgi:putative membrane protein
MLFRILIGIGGNALALYTANYFVSGFFMAETAKNYVLASIVLGVLNWTIKPILKAISFPLILISLGLFTIVINVGILWLLDRFFSFISIADLASLFWATMVISLVNLVMSRKL